MKQPKLIPDMPMGPTTATQAPAQQPAANPMMSMLDSLATRQPIEISQSALQQPAFRGQGATSPILDTRSNMQPLGFAEGGMVPQQAGMMQQGALPQQPISAVPSGTPQQNIMPMQNLQAEIQRFMQQNPQQVQQIQQVIMQALQSGELSMEDLNMAVQMATAAAQNPSLYPRLRQLAIQRGFADDMSLPQQYDQGIVFAILLAGAAVQNAVGGQQVPGMQPQGQQPVAQMAMGGFIPKNASPTGDKTGKADDIPIRVSGGEFVIPKHVVDAKGTEFFNQMLEKYKQA